MFSRIATLSVFATSFVLAVPQDAHAQAPAARHSLTAGIGVFNFDLSGTGNATGVHLHYQISVDGLIVDPLSYGAEPPLLDSTPVL